VQLVSLCLYSPDGDLKTIDFKVGRLNVITGVSKTGKSVLVKLIDYCLGRSKIPTSAGNVEKSLAWVGALWQLNDGARAFVGRPVPQGAASNVEVMLTIGEGDLTPPPFGDLVANTNAKTMRIQLGALIGITESRIDPPPGSLRDPLRTHLGHAAFLCLQNQDEISSSERIFHRSGERGVDDALRDTIPYFLGAVAPDQALQKALLRQEQRRLQRLERELREAEDAVVNIDEDLNVLFAEAVQNGLAEPPSADATPMNREQLVSALHRASREATPATEAQTPSTQVQDNSRRTRNNLEIAEDDLDQLMQQRTLLLDESEGSSAYDDALEVQLGRLTSLNLLPLASEAEGDGDGVGDGAPAQHRAEHCPVCGQESETPDPTTEQMRKSLERLGGQLAGIRGASAAKSEALEDLNRRIVLAQGQVRQARAAVETTIGANAAVGQSETRRRDFTRGRIDATLARAPQADENRVVLLRERIGVVEGSIVELQRQLSDDTARERLNTRLNGVGRDLTAYAQELGLEHSEHNVRIDLAQLTVVAEVDDDPVPLYRIGSAENWIGYHVAGHLALHKSFIRHNGPVPRMLVVDQPSQGHYPSAMAKQNEEAPVDADDAAVSRLYRLMYDFVEANEGKFQIIVVDHADFDEPWFRDSIVEYWRGGDEKLIPAEWVAKYAKTTPETTES